MALACVRCVLCLPSSYTCWSVYISILSAVPSYTSSLILFFSISAFPTASPLPSVVMTSPLPSNTCERMTLVIIVVSASCGALLCLVLVLLIFCIIALTRTRRRQRRNVRIAGSARRIDPYPARRRVLPSAMIHLHTNTCYGTNPLLLRSNEESRLSSQHSSPHNFSPNASYSSTSTSLDTKSHSPTANSKLPIHQYDDVILSFSSQDEEPTQLYDTLQPKPKDKGLSRHQDYENTRLTLLPPTHSDRASQSQAAINTLLPPNTLTHTHGTVQDRLSILYDEDYVNELDGPLTTLPMQPQNFHSPHQTPLPHTTRPCGPRDYEVPVPSRGLRKNFTMKW